MHRTTTAFLLAAFAAFALPIPLLMGGPILPNLPPGSTYQLIFVTSDTIDGTAGTEAPYNALVNTDAAPINSALASAGIFGVSWHAITSTADGTDANLNAPWGGVPVYNTQAIQVNGGNLYAGSLVSPVSFDENGTGVASEVWTGTLIGGVGGPGLRLGNPEAIYGNSQFISGWGDGGTSFTPTPAPLYGLSPVITVPMPEPATLSLLASGVFLMAGMRLVRRRRKTHA